MSKPPLLEPDREQLTRFVQTLFKYAGTEGFVSLRSFVDGGRENQVFNIEAVGLNKGLGIVIAAAEDRARRAAQARKSVVFSPVMAVLKSAHSAGETTSSRAWCCRSNWTATRKKLCGRWRPISGRRPLSSRAGALGSTAMAWCTTGYMRIGISRSRRVVPWLCGD